MVLSPSQEVQAVIHLHHFTLGSHTVEVCPAVHKVLYFHIKKFLPSVTEVSVFGEWGRE